MKSTLFLRRKNLIVLSWQNQTQFPDMERAYRSKSYDNYTFNIFPSLFNFNAWNINCINMTGCMIN